MPNPVWSLPCHPGLEMTDDHRCTLCETPAVWGGWRLGIIEAMGQYANRYKLPPVGMHRHLTDALFKGAYAKCERCNGSGYYGVDPGDLHGCPVCRGRGGRWTISAQEFRYRRRLVLEAYPAIEPLRRHRNRSVKGAQDARLAAESRYPNEALSTPRHLKHAAAWMAFKAAQLHLGSNWRLDGEEHCRRVTLRPAAGRAAFQGARLSSAIIQGRTGRYRVYPLALVQVAAELLGVSARVLVSKEE